MKNIQYMALACALVLSGQLYSDYGTRGAATGKTTVKSTAASASTRPVGGDFNKYIITEFGANLQRMFAREINQDKFNESVNRIKSVAQETQSDMNQVRQAMLNMVRNSRLAQSDKAALVQKINQSFVNKE